jgi:hypothetical protein
VAIWRALAGKPLFNEAIRYWRGQLVALGYFTVTGCIPQPQLASVARGYRRNQSKYKFTTVRANALAHPIPSAQ